jgi:hypothetical protein
MTYVLLKAKILQDEIYLPRLRRTRMDEPGFSVLFGLCVALHIVGQSVFMSLSMVFLIVFQLSVAPNMILETASSTNSGLWETHLCTENNRPISLRAPHSERMASGKQTKDVLGITMLCSCRSSRE